MAFLRKVARNPRSAPAVAAARPRASTNPNPTPIVICDEPTSAYYDDLVNAAGRHGDFATVRNLLNKRVRDGCFNTGDTFKFLTHTETSLSALHDLLRALSRLDRGFPGKSAFDALIARLCRLGRLEDALRAVETMASAGFGLNAVTFHPILNLLTRRGDFEEARRVVGLMRDHGVPLDLTAHNHFLTAHCFRGDLASAARAMEEIEREGLGADTRTYDALVLGACRAGKVGAAVGLLGRMEEEGVSPLYSTHVHAIKAMVKRGWGEQAAELVRVYGGRDRALDRENYGVVASELIRMKKVGEAKRVVEEMAEKGLIMGEKLREFYRSNSSATN
ncbi:pentatricopeptide repeat-containing protein At3g56030, mitochondrial [Rhodamnia argentea]|uniref:Pentatricopeptide repeat-containing protein At3g56030, mitochondrial n=1 Tax=Rhodamnia argentea TaxID=178133 RepID=A0A8B8Q286_9MYRT|nr:pentatricopeptide repeat-containing protein At3g56030, mitochondrial [Rhodamnia argentea]